VSIGPDQINGTVALTDFNSYALTSDLMENELIDTIALSKSTRAGSTPCSNVADQLADACRTSVDGGHTIGYGCRASVDALRISFA
jgi:hypothetical protein